MMCVCLHDVSVCELVPVCSSVCMIVRVFVCMMCVSVCELVPVCSSICMMVCVCLHDVSLRADACLLVCLYDVFMVAIQVPSY